MMSRNNQKKKNHSRSSGMDDWISSLAKQATQNSSSANGGVQIKSKEERKQKRAAKKAKRNAAKHQQHTMKQQQKQQRQVTQSIAEAKQQVERNRRRLKSLSSIFHELRSSQQHREPYIPVDSQKRKKKKTWNEHTIQPRPQDYSGIGLARESLWVSFLDPSFEPKLVEEFSQHIPGFYGKQRTKAMKRQLDSNMLWRQLENKNKLSKKLQSMTPDQRVEAMIDAGML